MRVHEILHDKGDEVVIIDPAASLRSAVTMMSHRRIGALVASADGNRLDGLLRESEVLAALAAHAMRIEDLRVGDVMIRSPEVCGPDAHIKAVMNRMTRTRCRHMPVVQGRRICGLISVGDIVKYRMDEMEKENLILREAYIATH